MRIVTCVLSLIIACHLSYSQNFWAYSAGSIKEDEAMDICYDNSGNIISAGYFSGTTVFNVLPNVTLNPNALGSPDIYISKSNSSGQVLWATKAGGNGSDRALSVKADANGNIYITGFYYGSATFGTTTLTSVSGSQDGFIAKLDGNGNFLWAKSFGGNHAEWGNAIAIDDVGNPIITGQFQGTTNFGGTTLTSIVNPNTLFSSFDVFIAKYTSSGILTWVKQGKGKYDDRGLDIITDPLNNIYVCGQFSDTIQFQNQHTNTIMNATFIIKYNAAGQEQWFKKAAGVFSIAYSMVMDNANQIYITGDFQGTFTYFGTSNNSFINGAYVNNAFLLKIDNNGNFIWGKSEASNNYVSGKCVAIDNQQNPYIFGEFGCTMNEYSDVYGSGIFNSVGFGDLFITKYNSVGVRQWFKQFGGPRNDKAHSLLLESTNNPIMAGSYEHHLNIPSTVGSLTTINNSNINIWNTSTQPSTYCSANNNYSDYTSLSCQGYTDMFIIKGIDLTRNPYDYYDRSGLLCNLNFVGSCINGSSSSCADTIKYCLNGIINAQSHASTTELFFNNYGIGPIQTYIWNNNSYDTLANLSIYTSGYNHVKVTTLDGCYSSVDTVYVKINPLPPPPVITDSYGANTLQPPLTNSIHICGPSTITLTGGHVQNTTYSWSGNYISTHDSVAIINSSGSYYFNVVDSNGCGNANSINVLIEIPIPQFIPKQITDSISICKNNAGLIIVYDTISNPTGIYPYPCVTYSVGSIINSSSGVLISSSPYCDLSLYATAQTTGWYKYIYQYEYTNLCGTYSVTLNDSIYINVKPLPTGTIVVSGNPLLCPGDSALIGVASVNISSPSTNYTVFPSIPFWVSQPGNVLFNLQMIDTISGCSNFDYSTVSVTLKPNPFIILNPYNSIICPNDSVLLTLNLPNATNYEWHGPSGLLQNNTQSFYSSEAGFYHCIVTDNTGCVFTTNTVELKQYATPYLISTPTNIICNNNPISLHVITLDSTLIVWNAPLFGNGATKQITNAGVYSCQVTMCGITTSLSIQIIGSNPLANISSFGSTAICPFDSVLLTGNAGMANYVWQPGNHLGQNYSVHSSGSYTLQVTDNYGCTAVSAPVSVSFTSSVVAPSFAINDTICAGQTATLSISGNNTIHWFPNSNSGQIMNTGNTYITPVLNSQTTYYAASVSNTGCHSFGVPVTAYMYQTSLPPLLIGDTIVCKHDTLKIVTPLISGANYIWTGPGILSNTTNSVVILDADSTFSGNYIVQISGFGCTSPTSTISIQVINSLMPTFSAMDSICENTFYTATVNAPNSTNTYTWHGSNNFTSTNDTLILNPANTSMSGLYSLTSTQFGCVSNANTFMLTVLPLPQTPTITSNSTVCVGDSVAFILTPPSNYTTNWYGPNNFSSHNYNPHIFAADTTYSGLYGVVLNNYFCISQPAYSNVSVLNYPVLTLSNDTTACDDVPLVITSNSSYANYLWNTGATTPNLNVTQSGIYWIASSNGMCTVTNSVTVNLIPCNISAPNVFSPNGDGLNDVFMFKSEAMRDVKCEIWNRWGVKVFEFNGANNGWNGSNLYNNKICSDGTYFFIAQITTIELKQQTIKGFVTLMH